MSYESQRYDMMVKIEEGKKGPSTEAYLDSKGLMICQHFLGHILIS